MTSGTDSSIPDDVFAQRVQQLLMATPEQLESARAFTADCARQGKPLSLADALVKLGIITLAQRGTVEQRLLAEQKTGLARLLHYKLLRKIGEGAMGAVYVAQDDRDGRQVALKVLPRSAAARPGFIERFQREADAAGRLRHPNIVHAFSSGEDQGWYFFVMEYCEGETQDKRLKRDGFIPAEEATAIILQVTRALQYAHGQGVVHRDVKPSNILLTPDGTARILDLGLSKNLHDEGAAFRTQSGMTVGTPHYMAPEQARGDQDVDGRADLYSLGATYYHFVTGDTPFHGSSAFEIVTQHLTSELPDPRDLREEIPDGVVQVIRMMMAKRREDRYADAGALAADLERVLKGEAPRSRPLQAGESSVGMPRVPRPPRAIRLSRTSTRAAAVSAALEPVRRPRRRRANPVAWLLLGGLAAAVLIPVLVLLWPFGGTPPPAGAGRPDPPADLPGATRPSPPPPKPKPEPEPGPKAGEPNDLKAIREASARRQLEDLKRMEQEAAGLPEDRLRRVEGFAASYADTAAGREALELAKRIREHIAPPATPVDDAWVRTVRAAPAEEQVRRVVAKLRALNPGWTGRAVHGIDNGRVLRLNLADAALHDITPLRVLGDLQELNLRGALAADLAPLRGMPLRELNLEKSKAADLAPLAGMPLERLSVAEAPVTDLAPLRGMPLVSLNCAETRVRSLAPLRGAPLKWLSCGYLTALDDLSPLRGMPLAELHCPYTAVADLSPLKGLPLTILRVDWTRVVDLSPLRGLALTYLVLSGVPATDLSPLQGLPLRTLGVDFAVARDCAALRSIETLRTINEYTAASFWALADEASAFAKGPPALPAEKDWARPVDLLALADPVRDAAAGVWSRRDGGIVSDAATSARLDLPWAPPEEYDVRVDFTRLAGTGDVNVMLARGPASFDWQMAAFGNALFGFSAVNGYGLSRNPTRVRLGAGLASGRRHATVVLVRKEGVKAFLDGALVASWKTDYSDLGPDVLWRTRGAGVLGLGSYSSPVLFHRAEAREVTGKGRAASGGAPAAAPPGAGVGVPLFNGRDLLGWEPVGGAVPRVEEGAIVLRDGAEIQRRVAAADFDLRGAVRLIRGAPVNVGCIVFRRQGHLRGGTGVLFHADGDVHLFSGSERPAKSGPGAAPMDRWLAFVLRVTGESVTLDVDGKTVLRGTVPRAAAGNLALYTIDTGAAMAFKDLRLSER